MSLMEATRQRLQRRTVHLWLAESTMCASSELALPRPQVIHEVWYTGMRFLDQHAATVRLMQQWIIRQLVIDRIGISEGLPHVDAAVRRYAKVASVRETSRHSPREPRLAGHLAFLNSDCHR